MKKLKTIVAAILRGIFILSPGAAYLWWLWGKAPGLVAATSAIGLETLWLVAFAFGSLLVQMWSDRKNLAEADEEPLES